MGGAKRTVFAAVVVLAGVSTLQAQQRIAWVANWATAQQQAAAQQRLILIHFWDQNCPPCLQLERSVFNRPEVIRAMGTNYVPLKVNVSQNRQMARDFRIDRWPTDVIVTARGEEVFRGVSPLDANRYIAQLDQVAAHQRLGLPADMSQNMLAQQTPANGFSRTSQFPLSPSGASATGDAYRGFGPQASTVPPVPSSRPTAISPSPSMVAQGHNPPSGPRAGYGMSNNATASSQARSPAPQMTENRYVTASGPIQPASNTEPFAQQPASAAPAESPSAAPSASPGLEGYCPVTLVEQEKWVKGNPQWGAVHRGRTYLFAGPEQQQRFLANYDKYAPVLSGYDPVKYTDLGTLVDGKRAHGVFYRNQIFLFSSEASLQQFWNSPERYAPAVRAEQQQAALSGNPRR